METKDNTKKNFNPDGSFAKGNQVHTLRENPGRPRKQARFIEAFERVVDAPQPNGEPSLVGNAIILKDTELLLLTNDLLEKEERVSPSTFSGWKTEEYKDEADKEIGLQFRALYEKAMVRQKQALFQAMLDNGEQRSWGRYAWIIERRFDEWNLRTKSIDETPDLKRLVFVRESKNS